MCYYKLLEHLLHTVLYRERKLKMRKSYAILMIIIGIILVGTVGLLAGGLKGGGFRSQHERTVSVKDGVIDPGQLNGNFMVDETGDYRLGVSWRPEGIKGVLSEGDIGFVTAVVIEDDKGEVIFKADGLALEINTDIRLEKGIPYQITHYFFNDKAAFTEFAKNYICGIKMADSVADQYSFEDLASNGSWNIDSKLTVKRVGVSVWVVTGLSFAIIFSVILTVILTIAITRSHRLESPKYDERQEMERGYGFKYAFFSLLTYIIGLLIVDAAEIFTRIDMRLFYAGGIFIGVCVYVVYCIWTESYFALNQDKKTVMIIFVVIAAFNLALGITNIIRGTMIEDGHFTVHIANLMCAAMFIVLFVTVLLKKMKDKKSEE